MVAALRGGHCRLPRGSIKDATIQPGTWLLAHRVAHEASGACRQSVTIAEMTVSEAYT